MLEELNTEDLCNQNNKLKKLIALRLENTDDIILEAKLLSGTLKKASV